MVRRNESISENMCFDWEEIVTWLFPSPHASCGCILVFPLCMDVAVVRESEKHISNIYIYTKLDFLGVSWSVIRC